MVVFYGRRGLLDIYDGSAAAYSLRQLSSLYIGPVVRVRRSSDSSELDFNSVEVNNGSLESWVGNGDGFVTIWYDQSGNGRDATQTTAANQPKIVSSGFLVTENGKAAIEFDGTNDRLSIGTIGISGSQDRSFFVTFRPSANIFQDTFFSFGQISSGKLWQMTPEYGVRISSGAELFESQADTNLAVLSFLFSGPNISDLILAKNGALQSATTTVSLAVNTTDGNATIGDLPGVNYYFIGTIQELIIYPTDQSANRIAIENNINNHYKAFYPTVLLLHMDGTNGSTGFIDSSYYNHAITANGNAAISTTQSKFGGASAAFDGTGDYLTVPNDASVQLGSSDFTIEGWFYSNVSSPIRQYHLFNMNMVTAGDRAVGLSIRGDAGFGGKLRLVLEDDASVQRVTIDSPYAFPANSWQHVAVVRSGAAVTLYLNGTNIGFGSLPSAGTSLLAGTLNWVGNLSFATGTFTWDGYIDEFRITKGRALYVNNFLPPTSPHPNPFSEDPYFSQVSLLLPMDDQFVDKSFNQHVITANGNAQISTAQSKFGGASAAFDGTGDYLTVPDDASLEFGSGDFTIEAWIYLNSLGTSQTICQKRISNAVYGGWGFFIYNNLVSLVCDSNTTAPWDVFITTGTQITSGEWHHVAVTRNGSVFTTWLNGVQSATATSSATINTQATSVGVGAISNGDEPLDGYIDDLRITKGVALYGSFQPPAQAFPDSAAGDPDFADVSLLLHMDGADGSTTFIDSSPNGHTVTANGNAQISTAQSKFGGASGAFDGTGDGLSISTSADFSYGTGDFTIECWLYLNTTGTFGIVSHGAGNVANPYFYINGATPTFFFNATAIATGPTVSVQTWTHIAAVRDGTNLRVFTNGVSGAVAANSTNLTAAGPITIGMSSLSQQNLNGYIDDLRITKGMARYDVNFTPPVRSHPIP